MQDHRIIYLCIDQFLALKKNWKGYLISSVAFLFINLFIILFVFVGNIEMEFTDLIF